MRDTGGAGAQADSDLVLSAVLSKSYPEPVGTLLQEFRLNLRRGEILAVLGASGSGKTTILNILAGITPPDRPFEHEPLPPHTADIAYAFQHAALIPWRDCEANAFFESDVLGLSRSITSKRVESLMELTGLARYRHLLPDQLSSGMQQRLQVVRTLARRVHLYLFDEPLGAVDQPLRLHLSENIRSILKGDGAAAVWVTHDTLEASAVSDRVMIIGSRPLKIITEHYIDRSGFKDTPYSSVPTALEDTPHSLEALAAFLRGALYEAQQSSVTPNSAYSPRIEAVPALRAIAFNKLLNWLLPIVPLILVLVIWEVIARWNPSLMFFISAPSQWSRVMVSEMVYGSLIRDLLITLREAVTGLIIGLGLGVAVGLATSSSKRLSQAVRPYLVGVTAIPLFILAPAFILWFGIGEQMKVALAVLSSLPVVSYLVHDAALSAQGTYYRYLLHVGARRRRLFTHLILPSTLEGILLSVRPAAVAALVGAFLGEFIASEKGLGHYIVLEASRYHIAEVFAGVFLLFLTAALIDGSSRWLSSKRAKIISWLNL